MQNWTSVVLARSLGFLPTTPIKIEGRCAGVPVWSYTGAHIDALMTFMSKPLEQDSEIPALQTRVHFCKPNFDMAWLLCINTNIQDASVTIA